MAVTKIADVIVPEIFNPYVIQRTMELSDVFQSGIVQRTEEFDRIASSSAETVQMPYWNDLTGADEVLSDQAPLAPDKITTGKDVAVILRRGRAWGANDLAANLAGDDPMRAIADLVAAYWARRYQATLLSTLDGIFAAASMSGLVHDITAKSGAEAKITALSTVDAAQLLGDAKGNLTAMVMHSATEAALAKQSLIVYQPANPAMSGQTDRVPTFLGKRVIVDDGCPIAGGTKYTTYLFGPGAVAYGAGSPVGFVATETARQALAGEDLLVNRQTFLFHTRGIRWKGSATGSSPTNTELSTGTNWERVYETKAIRVVKFVHLLVDGATGP